MDRHSGISPEWTGWGNLWFGNVVSLRGPGAEPRWWGVVAKLNCDIKFMLLESCSLTQCMADPELGLLVKGNWVRIARRIIASAVAHTAQAYKPNTHR